jgi:putative sigma-54 modulation protein
MKIGIPGDDVIVRKVAKSFEEAINSASDSVERILKRRKEKVRAQG